MESCDNLTLENLTIENTYSIPSHKGQAETIYFNSSYKLTVENCSLISWQDTFLCKGKVWVHNSLIAGHVDYIWGYPEACLFEDCEIRSRAGGYLIQARVPKATDKGFVFLNCKLTAESGVKDGSMYLARSGGSTEYFDNVVFVNCTMGPVIAPAGWHGHCRQGRHRPQCLRQGPHRCRSRTLLLPEGRAGVVGGVRRLLSSSKFARRSIRWTYGFFRCAGILYFGGLRGFRSICRDDGRDFPRFSWLALHRVGRWTRCILF